MRKEFYALMTTPSWSNSTELGVMKKCVLSWSRTSSSTWIRTMSLRPSYLLWNTCRRVNSNTTSFSNLKLSRDFSADSCRKSKLSVTVALSRNLKWGLRSTCWLICLWVELTNASTNKSSKTCCWLRLLITTGWRVTDLSWIPPALDICLKLTSVFKKSMNV